MKIHVLFPNPGSVQGKGNLSFQMGSSPSLHERLFEQSVGLFICLGHSLLATSQLIIQVEVVISLVLHTCLLQCMLVLHCVVHQVHEPFPGMYYN